MHNTYKLALLCAFSTCTAFAAQADTHNHSIVDDHAPIGVMGEHVHKAGEWMTSYRYSRMDMKGNRDGTSNQTAAQVHNNFMVAPLEMDMQMHMFGLMYGVTDELTVMGMAPYVQKSMKHVNRAGRHFSTKTRGIGDVKISGLYKFYEHADANQSGTALLNFGVSLPTGSVDERDTTPLGYQKLPYPMQLGSGTVDPKLGLTYTHSHTDWSFGGQVSTVIRFGDNSENYRLGNEYNATTWISKTLADWISVSARLDGKNWGDIKGRDTDLNANMVPTARTDLRGGTRVDALLGVNLYQPQGTLKGHRLALEVGAPIYQHLDGPQLQTGFRTTIGWQKAF